MQQLFKLIAVSFALLNSSQSFSGGPLVLEGASGHTPVTYQNPDITIHVESGELGTLSNAQANVLVQGAFDLWSEVSTSDIRLTINSTTINQDIDITNFDTYLPSIDDTNLNAEDNLNPLIYDNDGEIIDAYFGVGQSDFTVGFAASIFIQGTSSFDEGYAVVNGKDLGLSTTAFKLLITHEIGHFIGLDHSQGDINNRETDFGSPRICTTSDAQAYPVMYPFVCRNTESLHGDDISALSALYPPASLNSDFGIIQGIFVTDESSAILGANIWAQNVTTGESYSIVSDYLKQDTGFYKLFLPAGTYTLHANSINPQFDGASGIGPYAESTLDRSFTAPHPITDVSYQGVDAGNDEVITVTAGQTQSINFSASGIAVKIAAADVSGEDDSIADLFGAASHITLIMLLGILTLLRAFSARLFPGRSR